MTNPDAYTLFSYEETRVTAEPSGLIAPVGLVIVGALTSTDARALARLRHGLFMMLAYLANDVVHTGGHIISSRYAHAPMDQFHLAAPMPKTVYTNNDVSPRQHKLRAIGGPVASGLALLLCGLWRPFTRPGSALRELLTLEMWMYTLVGVFALLPIPFVDGGSLLKWTLVERGQSPEQAEETVKQTNLGLSAVFGAGGLILALLRRWKLAAGMMVGAVQFLAIGLGKLKL